MTTASSGNRPDSGTGGPVGKGDYVVKAGDCIPSIAFEHGLFWKTVWDHPDNQELKEIRKDPNVLLPGDRVIVPPLRNKEEPSQTEQRHRFRLKGVPERLRVVFKIENKPRENECYRLIVDNGQVQEGTLDADGLLDVAIPPNAKKVHVIVGEGIQEREHIFKIGHVDPISELSGVQGRLGNLGYPREWGTASDEEFRSTLLSFQQDHGLEATGELDDATRDALRQAHGN